MPESGSPVLKLSCGMPLSPGHLLNENAEIWRDDRILRLIYRRDADLDLEAQKEVIRMLGLVDPLNEMPILLELESQVMIHKESREFAHRFSNIYQRPAIAMLAHDLADKIQANFYAHYYRPKTPFKVFYRLSDAERWLHQKIDLSLAVSA